MTYLEVKNWSQFQHYRDRNPVWVKLYLSLLDDYDFAQLTDAERGQLLMVWLLAARTNGRVPNDARWIAGRIACSGPFKLARLVRGGWLVPVEAEQSASKPLAGPYQNDCLEGEGEKEGERDTTTRAVRGALPGDAHDALDRVLRSSGNPDGVVDELARLMAVHPKVIPTGVGMRGEDPELVGRCLVDLANSDRPTWNPGYFRGMLRKAKAAPNDLPKESPGERALRLMREGAA